MSADTSQRILEAALSCFVAMGYEQTTTARIREQSGVSNGALFHHFPTKEAIADALYVEAMASYQEGLWELLRGRPRSARAAVRGTIAHQLQWTEANPDRARFLYMRGHLDWDSPQGERLHKLNRDLADAYRDWMAPLIESGWVRRMSMLVLTAVVTGPVHAISRRWLAGQLQAPLASYLDELADAACAAVTGKPSHVRGASKDVAHSGRVAIQLLSEDGAVVAEGEAIAGLHRSPIR
jgi:AcrR family transcriptional regulator